MYRKAERVIKKWIENSNKALLVTGARQIGKTWLVRDEIGKSGFKIFEINFLDQPGMVNYLNAQMSAADFLVKLKMIMPEECKPHETIVFFDEIQRCPEIMTKIKFLVEEGSFKYVMSGSLLGVELHGITSAPVGYLSILKMYPMDFEEFMIANGVSRVTLDMLQERFDSRQRVDDFIHQKLMSLYFVYLIVGGMPDAVKRYIETKDIREVDRIQKDIVELYKEGFSQYEHEDKKLKLKSIYEVVPAELNKQNKKFVFTMLNKELKFDRYENSFFLAKGSRGCDTCI
ncbi:MAG: AAA family ATPase [Lachnospiraceae bacterium]|nr:AAA family ATPase [Lachnospiraceae bacterium]